MEQDCHDFRHTAKEDSPTDSYHQLGKMQLFNLISLLALTACTSALALPPASELTSRFLTIQSTYIEPRVNRLPPL